MGKGGRFCCIFTPYVLTIASLICIIIVGLGSTKQSDNNLNNLYFFRANLQNFTTSSKTTQDVSQILSENGVDVSNSQLTDALEKAKQASNLKDFYTIGLWGYCDGDVKDNHFKVTHCSKPEPEFWFNPMKVWNMEGMNVQDALPGDAKKTLNIYKNVSKWMFIAYIIAFIATCVELLVGIFAICSRWGSCVTTLVSGVALLFTAAAFKSYGISGSIGKNMFAATWLAVVFALGACLFWLISSCCCSGRSPYNNRNKNTRGVSAEKAPYTYEPLGPDSRTPYGAYNTSYPPAPGNNVPMHDMGRPGYEPYRHV
ncbi:integral membrane protein [Aspergillus sclerotialis]|uniref:Integral membrane protein n=1 Tax=Aspergillus sclerotialis TaxID=2070753 RepID=A0A3A2ZKW1_9EURO|nr:integral membrane protein [Aspergillus sclerotialis]